MDVYRRRELTRIVLDNTLTTEECEFMAQATALVQECKPPVIAPTAGSTLTYAEKMLCVLNKKIPAIKAVRERRNDLGLKEAKDLVDEWCRTYEHNEMASRQF